MTNIFSDFADSSAISQHRKIFDSSVFKITGISAEWKSELVSIPGWDKEDEEVRLPCLYIPGIGIVYLRMRLMHKTQCPHFYMYVQLEDMDVYINSEIDFKAICPEYKDAKVITQTDFEIIKDEIKYAIISDLVTHLEIPRTICS